MTTFLLVGVVIVFTVLSQLILKFGQHTFYYPTEFSTMEVLKMAGLNLTNWYVLGCVALTLIGGLTWLLVIQHMPLSSAYPLMSLNYVTIYLISWWLFNEPISIPSAIGMVFIVIGTGLLGFK